MTYLLIHGAVRLRVVPPEGGNGTDCMKPAHRDGIVLAMEHSRRTGVVITLPVTYVLNERDRPIPTSMQEEMIGRLPSAPRVVRLDTGHIPRSPIRKASRTS